MDTSGTLLPGHQHSVFLTDNGAAPNGYLVTILEDQQIAAAQGHSAFRFLNQAAKTGAVDVYMVPAGTTLANSIPIVTDLPVGATAGYISFTSQTVTMVDYAHRRHHAAVRVHAHGADRRRSAHRIAHGYPAHQQSGGGIHRSHRRRTDQLASIQDRT